MSRRTQTALYGIFVFLMVLAVCIAYAQVVTELKVEGEGDANEQKGVYITDVEYLTNNGADTENSKINYYLGTMLDSKVVLGSSTSSSITYQVTIKNNTDREQVFIGIVKDETNEEIYSNTSIQPNVETAGGITGITEYETTIAPGETITFPVTYAYAGTDTSNSELQSKINFRFREVPIIELSNEGETYTLENISAGHEEEYEFTVSNYNENYNNGVPLTYTLETTLTEGSPLEAKIYDKDGNEVTGSIEIAGDGSSIDHTYTLKLTWDSNVNGSEYQGKQYTCNVKVKATPDDTDYGEYKIEKEFGVNITTNTTPTLEVTVSDITSTTATITATGEDGDGDSLQYTLEINGQTYTSDTGVFDITGLGAGKTYQYTVSVTDGYETVTEIGELTTECINYVVEYIESTGTQYIDTGIIPDSNTNFELMISLNDATSTLAIMGARKSNTTTPYFNMWIISNKFRWDYYTSTTSVDLTVAEDNKVMITKEGNITSFEANGTSVAINDNTTAFTSPYSMYLFNVHQTTEETRMAKMKLYYFKLYQNDVLVRDFVPALDDSGVACLYDKVTKQYFYNSGTGTFNYEMVQVGHIFGDWEVTKPATCTETGIQTKTCTVCGATEIEEIPIDTENGHNYVDGVCTICGDVSNVTPVIVTNADYKTGKKTTQFTIQMSATDENGDDLTYELFYSTSENGTYESAGTSTASAGSSTTIAKSGLSEYTPYWWYITVTDGTATVTSEKQTLNTYCSGSSTCPIGTYCTEYTTNSTKCTACTNGYIYSVCNERLSNPTYTTLYSGDYTCYYCGAQYSVGRRADYWPLQLEVCGAWVAVLYLWFGELYFYFKRRVRYKIL